MNGDPTPICVIPPRSAWDRWLYLNADMFLRHIGTAGTVWIGVSMKHGAFQWRDLWAYLLSGAIVPTLFTILQKGLPGTGLPDGGNGATLTVSGGSAAGGTTPPPAPPAPTK